VPTLYTVKQLTKIFNKSAKTIRAWIHKGTLKALVIPDGTYLIPEESVKAMFSNAHPDYNILTF
jgi:excisionase family DNA binding protein